MQTLAESIRSFMDLLEKSLQTEDYIFHGYRIRVNTIPNNGVYQGIVLDNNMNIVSRDSANDINELKRNLESMVFNSMKDSSRKNMVRPDMSELPRSVNINPNTAFTRQVLENEIPTAIRLVNIGGINYLDIMTREYFEMFEESGSRLENGFIKLHDRRWNKQTTTKIYGIPYSINKVNDLGLEYAGIYALEEALSPDPEEYSRFKMDLVSYANPNRNTRHETFPFPAVTIAASW